MSDRLEALPGTGLVLRYGEVVGWAGPGATRGLVNYLTESAQRLVNDPVAGRSLANRLEQVLRRGDPEPATPFVMVGPTADGLEVVIHGRAQVWEGRRSLVPPAPPGWMRSSLAVSGVVLAGPAGETPSAISGDPAVNLVAGAVRGGGFALFPAGGVDQPAPKPDASPAPVPAPNPARAPSPLPPQRWIAVDLRSGLSESRMPLSISVAPISEESDGVVVEGRLCPHDHLNHPQALYCPWDGAAATHRSTIVEGPRPSLGFLVVDDGSTYSLDAGYVLGSDPDSDAEVRHGRARPLRLVDSPDPVAAVHAEIRLDGWDVQILDRSSPGGTFVLLPGAGRWTQVPPDVPVPLAPHTRVSIGRRVLVFESLWLS